MSRIEPETWIRLLAAPLHGDLLSARQAVPETTNRLLTALDADGQRHLLICLLANDEVFSDTQSRGISVITRELKVHGSEPRHYIDIVCQDATGHAAFDIIGGEIAEILTPGAMPPADAVRRTLARWRRFWGQLPKDLLSREQILGLFAELRFLDAWLLPRTSTLEAVMRWRGPYGGRHDFEWTRKSVEVKATTSMRGRIHKINGLEQLSPPEEGELLFFSVLLREEQGATNTLPEMIATCQGSLANDADAISLLENALDLAGYSPVHDDEYRKLRFRIAGESLFVVRENFPRIIPATFPLGVPAGVERIDYEINLDGSADLIVARTPAEATDL